MASDKITLTYFTQYTVSRSIEKNLFIGSISCDDRLVNKLRNVDYVTTRSEIKKLYCFLKFTIFETIEIFHRLITNERKL